MMMENKNHWYDGTFYDKFIAPNQQKLFAKVIKFIEADKSIIDVGCGTGFFSFSVADKCKSALGIDLSKRNIDKANKNLINKPNSKLTFRHANLNTIITENIDKFDYAVLTYVIHEVDENERIPLINEISQVADKIIIGDFLVPRPKNFTGKLSRIIEFIAGSEHYRNFRNYVANGGIPDLAKKSGLTIISEYKNIKAGVHIAVLTK